MNEIYLYGKIGFDHIVDWGAMDHILFLLALTSGVNHNEYKKIGILITAFTIGHSLTLFFGVYDQILISGQWVEFFIPLTIVVTSAMNLLKSTKPNVSPYYSYMLILFFGFIHGMGFANDLRMMLAKADSLFIPLISMNFGLEIGQLLLVSMMMLLSFIFMLNMGISESARRKYLSVVALCGGVYYSVLHLPYNN